jgi:threonine dehydrogenase-like Zn-dependent dehydrogenase
VPRELVAIGPRQPVLREYAEPELGPGQVRVRAELGSPKHGTELGLYRGTSSSSMTHWDSELRLSFTEERTPGAEFPMPLGNMCVGVVTEVGGEIASHRVGDRVYGHLPLRETHVVKEAQVRRVPDGMSNVAVICLDPALYALTAVRDSRVRLGDAVAVFGLGAIGLVAAQMARLSGAAQVFGIDPMALRREVAAGWGVTVLDPTHGDVAAEIKQAAGRQGVDAAIDLSGSFRALEQAVRCVRYGGVVVSAALYPGGSGGLPLGTEWHRNQVTLVSSRTSGDPSRDHPLWDVHRVWDTCMDLLRGRIDAEPIVQPRVTFDESAEAFREIDEHPERSIKLGVTFG